jgi:hypothetical protein
MAVASVTACWIAVLSIAGSSWRKARGCQRVKSVRRKRLEDTLSIKGPASATVDGRVLGVGAGDSTGDTQ